MFWHSALSIQTFQARNGTIAIHDGHFIVLLRDFQLRTGYAVNSAALRVIGDFGERPNFSFNPIDDVLLRPAAHSLPLFVNEHSIVAECSNVALAFGYMICYNGVTLCQLHGNGLPPACDTSEFRSWGRFLFFFYN
jgi:hypothetical protein